MRYNLNMSVAERVIRRIAGLAGKKVSPEVLPTPSPFIAYTLGSDGTPMSERQLNTGEVVELIGSNDLTVTFVAGIPHGGGRYSTDGGKIIVRTRRDYTDIQWTRDSDKKPYVSHKVIGLMKQGKVVDGVVFEKGLETLTTPTVKILLNGGHKT